MGTAFSQEHIFSDRTEELLIKYFDSTLTPEESLELEHLRLHSPELEQEMTAISSFDNALHRSHFDDIIDENVLDHEFIAQMQNRYQKIVSAPTPAPPAETSILTNKSLLWNGLTTWWKLPAIVVGSGLTFYSVYTLVQYDSTSPVVAKVSTQLGSPSKTPIIQPATPSEQIKKTKSGVSQKESQNESSPTNPAQHDIEPSHEIHDTQAKASIQQSNTEKKIEATLEQYLQTIQQHYREGNIISAALAEKSVGVLYREIGKYSESLSYFDKSLKTIKSATLPESEGEVLGEIALTYKAAGNGTKSQQYFEGCLETLSRCNSKNFEHWKKISSR